MNKKVVALTLASLLSMGGTSAIYTQETKAIETVETSQDNNATKSTSIDKQIIEKVLKDKFKVTEKELKNAKSKDGGMKELMEKKKISMDKLMSEVKNEMIKAIEKDLKDGKISKEEATKMKDQLQGKFTEKNPSPNKTPETTPGTEEEGSQQPQQTTPTPSQPQTTPSQPQTNQGR